MKTFREAEFESEVLRNAQPVLVDFSAAYCPPCRAMESHLQALAEAYAGRVVVGTVDTEADQGLAQRYNIRGVPTMVLFVAGKPVASVVGAVPMRKLEDMIQRHVG